MALGDFDNPKPFDDDQDYTKLKTQAQQSGQLFVDTKFPAKCQSMTGTSKEIGGITWKRPDDIAKESAPHLFIHDISNKESMHDTFMSNNGGYRFVAACRSLSMRGELWNKVCPDMERQTFNGGYAGIFHFRFYRFGEWKDVIIDDQLPCFSNKSELYYCRSQTDSEFCSALLQKAYAKIHGNFSALENLTLAEVLVDLTGAVVFPIPINGRAFPFPKQSEVFKTIEAEIKNQSLLVAYVKAPDTKSARKHDVSDEGLLYGAAYGVTGAKKMTGNCCGVENLVFKGKTDVDMVCLRYPNTTVTGGHSLTWKNWSTKINEHDRRKTGIVVNRPDEFWMALEDVCSGKHFYIMHAVLRVSKSFPNSEKKYHEAVLRGKWTDKSGAGGQLINNPQFVIDITDPQDDDVIISLEQENKGQKNPGVYVIVPPTGVKVGQRLDTPGELLQTYPVLDDVERDSCTRLSLKRGSYYILAYAEDRPIREFLLRVFTKSPCNLRQVCE